MNTFGFRMFDYDVKPKLPGILAAGLSVQEQGVSDYIVLKYLEVTHEEVIELARESAVGPEGQDVGRAKGLRKGDLVALRQAGEAEPRGRTRCTPRARDELYVISEPLGQNTFSLRTLLGNRDPLLSYGSNKYHADRLVKIEMPVLDDSSVERTLEYTTEEDTWFEAEVRSLALDDRVYMERMNNPVNRVWADLTRMRYRWTS